MKSCQATPRPKLLEGGEFWSPPLQLECSVEVFSQLLLPVIEVSTVLVRLAKGPWRSSWHSVRSSGGCEQGRQSCSLVTGWNQFLAIHMFQNLVKLVSHMHLKLRHLKHQNVKAFFNLLRSASVKYISTVCFQCVHSHG